MSNWGTPARTIRYGWHTEERTYGPNGELIACLIDGVVVDTREIASTEQDLVIQRLNKRLREGGIGRTMSITEFLLARIAEDEAVARAAIDPSGTSSSKDGRWLFVEYPYEGSWPVNPDSEQSMWADGEWEAHAENWDPARVLAECAAKRAIVELADDATSLDMSVDNDRRVGWRDESVEPYCGDSILYALAAVYADHPAYLDEWRVGA